MGVGSAKTVGVSAGAGEASEEAGSPRLESAMYSAMDKHTQREHKITSILAVLILM